MPEILIPVPVALTPEIVNSDPPELLSRMVWVVVLPVGTVPNATGDGVIVSSAEDEEVVAVALHPIASGEFAALLVTVSVPDAFPAFVGLNIAFRVALAPAARVTGNERPDIETPAPEADTAEIVMLDEPEFVKRTLCVDSLPIFTSPKFTEGGVTVKSEAFETPVAAKATITGESGALLLIIIFPEAAPLAAAVNVVETFRLWPGVKTMGSTTDFIENPDPATEIPETVRDLVPVFVMARVFDALWPTVRDPKLILAGLTSMDTPDVLGVPGFPATPTQPEVKSIPARIMTVVTACKMVGKEKPGERKCAFTPAPSRMGMSFITNAV